ncbi:hypothetical protein RJ641_017433 [Dillenia turbinata]|uniref:Uncharacterized protein n=1 Tax=Dillenia turbinata TaxID=194707 RepID=A0AAN8UVW9_9MAGN
MGGGESVITEGPIVAVAPLSEQREEQWRHFDNSVNAVSFGFVATAILISMFLIMAIFERFLRPRSSHSSSTGAHGSRRDLEAQLGFHAKLHPYPSPKMTIYARGVSVLMPGEEIPTFIAHPAPAPAPAPAPTPAPCPPERNPWPLHHQPSPCLNPLSSSI